MKIFEKYNFEVKDNILSKSEFKLLPFCQAGALVSEKLETLLLAADDDLKRDIGNLAVEQELKKMKFRRK